MSYGCGDAPGQVHWREGSPHHPIVLHKNVPIHCRARVEGGGMDDLPGPPTESPEVGPKGRCLHCLTSRASD